MGTGLLQSGPGNWFPPWGLLSWKENPMDLLFCKVVEVRFLAVPLPTLNEIPRLRSWRTPFPSVTSELFSPLPPPPSSFSLASSLVLSSFTAFLFLLLLSAYHLRGVRGSWGGGDLAGTGKEETGFALSYNERTGKARIIWVRARCEWRSRRRNT